jgi:hypothetical protein
MGQEMGHFKHTMARESTFEGGANKKKLRGFPHVYTIENF